MKRLTAVVLAVSTFAFARDAAERYPLKFVVLGSQTSTEDKRLWPNRCAVAGMGMECNEPSPVRTVRVVEVTGRITTAAGTTEYILVCKGARSARRCDELPAKTYPARWKGTRLEVLVDQQHGKGAVYIFEIKGERRLD